MNKRKYGVDWTKTIDKIKEQNDNNRQSFKDERQYKPQYKDDGTAQAIIRFLPSKDTDIPFVKVYSHSFRGPGGWYINDCPTTIGQDCPVCKANTALWDEDQDTVRLRKRRLSYYSNILVVKDPQNKENEGKVFIYRYGKKIHDKIMGKLSPGEDSIDEPIMIFDYYDGANFRLKIKKVKVGDSDLPNYDDCEFDSPSPIGTDAEIGKIHEQLYELKGFLEAVKPYDELQERFERVVGSKSSGTSSASAPTEEKADEKDSVEEEPTEFGGSEEEFFKELEE